MKRIIGVIAAITLLVTASTVANAAGANDGPKLNIDKGQSVTMMVAEEAAVNNVSSLAYYNQGPDKDQPGRGMLFCTSTKDPSCNLNDTGTRYSAQSVFPPCSTSKSDGCVESLELAPAGGAFEQAKFLKVGGGPKLAGDPALNFLEGSSPSLFESPSVANAAGTKTYAVVVKALQQFEGGKFKLRWVNALVIPYKEVKDPKYGTPNKDGSQSGAVNMCAYYEADTCGVSQDFAEDTQVRLKFRLPSSLGGWFRGRIKSPTMDVAKATATSNLITVEGAPVTVPLMQKLMTYDEIFAPGNEYLTKLANWGMDGGIGAGVEGSSNQVFKFIDYFRAKTNDTSTGQATYWGMTTTDSGGGNKCLAEKSKILGMVTTNALGYDGNAPSFKGGFLNYQVAGLHYAVGGTEVNQGTYDLVMRSDTARCLYGFSKAPLYATVSVLNDKGAKTMATTVVREKNGWLKMAAYGFTFSKKTIKVKITKKK